MNKKIIESLISKVVKLEKLINHIHCKRCGEVMDRDLVSCRYELDKNYKGYCEKCINSIGKNAIDFSEVKFPKGGK